MDTYTHITPRFTFKTTSLFERLHRNYDTVPILDVQQKCARKQHEGCLNHAGDQPNYPTHYRDDPIHLGIGYLDTSVGYLDMPCEGIS